MKDFEKQLTGFTDKIDYVRKISMGVPKIFDIDLAIVAADQVYDIAGNIFYIWSAPDEASYVNIKVNATAEPAIAYSVHTGLETPFDKLIITTPAGQTGTLQILYGTEAPEMLRIIDNRSTTVAGVGGILDQLRGGTTANLYWMSNITVGVAPVAVMSTNTEIGRAHV